MKATRKSQGLTSSKKLAVLGLFAFASFIPMMVLAAANAPGEVHRTALPPRQEVLSAPAARAQEPMQITVDEVKIVVPRSAPARPRAISAPCNDGEVRRVGALKATPEGAVGIRTVTLRCGVKK